ncbi:hypothetical protein [Cutibacterium namnetense]|uniref:hypothetical protein n=1 Tax=Cutibacterium namnetense TaxID=1574624 RepID=UPI00254F13E7|nr:hypothetical protein [Cutibacterium namnetense]
MSSLVLPNMMLAWTVSSNSSCQYDAASGIFYSWLKPIEQGQNVKFVAGLHGGCLRLVVLKHSRFTKVANLKGATIGVPSMHSSATMFFSMDLLDAGINPLPEAKQVTWATSSKMSPTWLVSLSGLGAKGLDMSMDTRPK